MPNEEEIRYECRKCRKSERFRQGKNFSIRDSAIKAGWYLPEPYQTRGLCSSCDGNKTCCGT